MNVLLVFHPQNTVFVWVYPQKGTFRLKHPQVSKKGFYSPIYEIKPKHNHWESDRISHNSQACWLNLQSTLNCRIRGTPVTLRDWSTLVKVGGWLQIINQLHTHTPKKERDWWAGKRGVIGAGIPRDFRRDSQGLPRWIDCNPYILRILVPNIRCDQVGFTPHKKERRKEKVFDKTSTLRVSKKEYRWVWVYQVTNHQCWVPPMTLSRMLGMSQASGWRERHLGLTDRDGV